MYACIITRLCISPACANTNDGLPLSKTFTQASRLRGHQAGHAGKPTAASLAATAAAHRRSRSDSARGRVEASTSTPPACATLPAMSASALVPEPGPASAPTLLLELFSGVSARSLPAAPASGGSRRSACSSTQRQCARVREVLRRSLAVEHAPQRARALRRRIGSLAVTSPQASDTGPVLAYVWRSLKVLHMKLKGMAASGCSRA